MEATVGAVSADSPSSSSNEVSTQQLSKSNDEEEDEDVDDEEEDEDEDDEEEEEAVEEEEERETIDVGDEDEAEDPGTPDDGYDDDDDDAERFDDVASREVYSSDSEADDVEKDADYMPKKKKQKRETAIPQRSTRSRPSTIVIASYKYPHSGLRAVLLNTDLKSLEPGSCVISGVVDAIVHYFIKQGELDTIMDCRLYATIERCGHNSISLKTSSRFSKR